ncbi:hypothetical protein Pcinc_010555 [Petrolisthes cinctipes]|uniref:Uncharacterized protein n=1 Tax=Petrolisthes cinctipes TaxID=88211 RepID=A0AAE1G550_PETCI|nr:hypothetical protein Pcinc_010555 [Petrolisthes cinctipes]
MGGEGSSSHSRGLKDWAALMGSTVLLDSWPTPKAVEHTAFTSPFGSYVTSISARSAIVTSVKEMAGIGNVDNPTDELRGARVRHDNTDASKIITQIQDTCSPFTGTVFNISTSKAASESTVDKKETFVATCLEYLERFKSARKKESITSFTNENV